MSAWTKLETGLAAIGLKDSRSDYKRHNKHFALYTEIANFHATGKKSEKKNEDVTLTIGSNTMKFHVTECDVTKHNRKKKVKNANGEEKEVDDPYWTIEPMFLNRINFVESINGGSGVSTLRREKCDDVWWEVDVSTKYTSTLPRTTVAPSTSARR